MKLTDIPVVFICPDHNEKDSERKLHTFTLLHKLGFKHVTMFQSGADSYPKCLVRATRDLLSEYLNDSPILILEDDVELTEWANIDMDIELPPDTDAFYFGFSKYGASMTSYTGAGYWSVDIEDVDSTYIRIKNMLATHSVLYVSKRYKQAVIEKMNFSLEQTPTIVNDVLIARLHREFNIYGYKYPFFYQSDQFGNNWYVKDATNFRF